LNLAIRALFRSQQQSLLSAVSRWEQALFFLSRDSAPTWFHQRSELVRRESPGSLAATTAATAFLLLLLTLHVTLLAFHFALLASGGFLPPLLLLLLLLLPHLVLLLASLSLLHFLLLTVGAILSFLLTSHCHFGVALLVSSLASGLLRGPSLLHFHFALGTLLVGRLTSRLFRTSSLLHFHLALLTLLLIGSLASDAIDVTRAVGWLAHHRTAVGNLAATNDWRAISAGALLTLLIAGGGLLLTSEVSSRIALSRCFPLSLLPSVISLATLIGSQLSGLAFDAADNFAAGLGPAGSGTAIRPRFIDIVRAGEILSAGNLIGFLGAFQHRRVLCREFLLISGIATSRIGRFSRCTTFLRPSSSLIFLLLTLQLCSRAFGCELLLPLDFGQSQLFRSGLFARVFAGDFQHGVNLWIAIRQLAFGSTF
jgi:hypothetical protein